MLAVYLACLVAGGFVILLSLVGGGESDIDFDGAADVDVDVDGSSAEAEGEGAAAAAGFLSVRNALFFACFFGMAGSLLTALGAAPGPTLAAALALGTGAAVAIHNVMAYLRRSQSGAIAGPAALAGARARVVIGPTRTAPGKVAVTAGDRTHLLVARIHGECAVDHFERGDTVVIVRVQDGAAIVANETFLA